MPLLPSSYCRPLFLEQGAIGARVSAVRWHTLPPARQVIAFLDLMVSRNDDLRVLLGSDARSHQLSRFYQSRPLVSSDVVTVENRDMPSPNKYRLDLYRRSTRGEEQTSHMETAARTFVANLKVGKCKHPPITSRTRYTHNSPAPSNHVNYQLYTQ